MSSSVPLNNDGLATHYHIARHHHSNGEVTLCGAIIDYPSWKGTAPDALTCEDCLARDT